MAIILFRGVKSYGGAVNWPHWLCLTLGVSTLTDNEKGKPAKEGCYVV